LNNSERTPGALLLSLQRPPLLCHDPHLRECPVRFSEAAGHSCGPAAGLGAHQCLLRVRELREPDLQGVVEGREAHAQERSV